MVRKKRGIEEAKHLNEQTYLNYFSQLESISVSLFKWHGLEELKIDERYVERILLHQGKIIFFKDDVLGLHLMLEGTDTGFDLYGNPVEFMINKSTSSGYYHKELTDSNAVIMYHNYLRKNMMSVLEMYALRLYEITRTQDVNVKAQKTPVFIKATDTQRLTMLQLYEQYDGNSPFIFGDKELMDFGTLEVLKTDAPYIADKLQTLKHDIWNEFYTWLGVGNAKQDKKERLVADEVAANDEQIEVMKAFMLKSRQDACIKINEMFGLNITVEYLSDFTEREEIDRMVERESDYSDGADGN